ncbi:MAG: leucyl-tRNA synthetase, partial [bacterium]
DLEHFQFNTAVSSLMELLNYLAKAKDTAINQTSEWQEAIKTLVLLIAPLAPHISEELWEALGQPYSIHKQAWPKYDASLAATEVFTLIVQINGKLRERIENVSLSANDEEVKQLALTHINIAAQLADKELKNVIYVPKRLVNIVVK